MVDADDIDPSAICARGTLTSIEAAAIRRGYYKDGIVGESDADALFAIEQNSRPNGVRYLSRRSPTISCIR